MKKLLLLALCAILSANVDARTLYVNAKRPNNKGNGLSAKKAKKTIQAAINAAKKGDTILVYPGTYAPIVTNNKKIAIKGVKGAAKTTIAPPKNLTCNLALARLGRTYLPTPNDAAWIDPAQIRSIGSVFALTGLWRSYSSDINDTAWSTGTSTTLAGFTLDGQKKPSEWYTLCGASGGTLKSCAVRRMGSPGRAVSAGNAVSPYTHVFSAAYSTLSNCTVRDNHASLFACVFSGCKLVDNACDYGFSDSCRFYNCLLSRNRNFAGELLDNSLLVNCSISGNVCIQYSTANRRFSVLCKYYNSVLFDNCIQLYEYNYSKGGYVYGEKTVHNADPGNTYAKTFTDNRDPKFVNAAKGDFRLAKGSPCIDKGKLTKALKKLVGKKDLAGKKRVKGKAIDIGCYEY